MTQHAGGAGRFRGKVALITGASRGIGLAIAEALAREGCAVVLTGRDARALRQAAVRVADVGAPVLAASCDARNPKAVSALFETVKRRFHRLDILVNNAGIAHRIMPISKLPLKTWREVLDANLTSLLIVTQAALPLLKPGASIVNNLSVSARKVYTGSAGYTAAKFGALGFTDTLREEVRGRGIRVVSLLPGPVDTALWDTLWPRAPRQRMIRPAQVAKIVLEALALPAEVTVEEIQIGPTSGAL